MSIQSVHLLVKSALSPAPHIVVSSALYSPLPTAVPVAVETELKETVVWTMLPKTTLPHRDTLPTGLFIRFEEPETPYVFSPAPTGRLTMWTHVRKTNGERTAKLSRFLVWDVCGAGAEMLDCDSTRKADFFGLLTDQLETQIVAQGFKGDIFPALPEYASETRPVLCTSEMVVGPYLNGGFLFERFSAPSLQAWTDELGYREQLDALENLYSWAYVTSPLGYSLDFDLERRAKQLFNRDNGGGTLGKGEVAFASAVEALVQPLLDSGAMKPLSALQKLALAKFLNVVFQGRLGSLEIHLDARVTSVRNIAAILDQLIS